MFSAADVRRVLLPRVAVGVMQRSWEGSAASRYEVEFALGREAAGVALASLGFEREVIPVGPQGEPRWPNGVVGSITHTADVALAVAARTADLAAIGIDIERQARRLDVRTMRRICTQLELDLLAEQGPDRLMPLTLFCAKEATYKALSGFVPRLGWHDVEFHADGADQLTGALSARAASFAPVATVSARVLVAGGFVVVCVEIPAVSRASQDPSARAEAARDAQGSR